MNEKKIYKEFDQCPICGDPLLKYKKDPTRLLCDCCGYNVSIETVIKYDDDERLRQALDALRSYEFDRAEDRYNLILEDNNPSSEVYLTALYGKLLSSFGVVYIKDFNGEAIPTFSEYDPEIKSVKDSDIYHEIVNSNAPMTSKKTYLDLIDKLDKIYKRIDKEIDEKTIYDFFICTKISRKTPSNPYADGLTSDSSYASRFYDFLSKSGYNVFYSDKCCNEIEYDSQILSALSKSKKMLVIATQGEYLESPWVQSEWRRWINFINCGKRSKDSLILCFPTYELKRFDLPRTLRKAQRYTSEIDAINAIISQKEEKKEVKVEVKETPKAEVRKPIQKVVKNRIDNKSPEELYMLAERYYEGDGVEKNLELALKYYTLAADLGDFDAQFALGLMYGNGEGCKVDLHKSFVYYKLAADQGHIYAQFEVGQCYKNGWGCEEDLDEAIRYFSLSSKQGYDEAKKALENLKKEKAQKSKTNTSQTSQIEKQPKKEIIKEQPKEKVITTDIPSSQTKENVEDKALKPEVKKELTQEEKINNALKEGNNYAKSKDYIKAVTSYKKAIELGSVEAYLRLGEVYENGLEHPKNFNASKESYEKALELGNADAYLGLSRLNAFKKQYFTALENLSAFKIHPTKVNDPKEQRRFLDAYDKLRGETLKAIDNNDINGTKEEFYNFSQGHCQSFKQIFYCLEKAASLGSDDALLDLADVYTNGANFPVNYPKAFEYYEKHAKLGHLETAKMLVSWYEKGTNCTKNPAKALEFLMVAARLNDLPSIKAASKRYLEGIGTTVDKEKAFECNLLGANLNDEECMSYCANAYELGIGTKVNYQEAFKLYEALANSKKISRITKEENLSKYYYYQYKVCEFYKDGKGVEKDETKAFSLYLEFSQSKKNYYVLYGLAKCYLKGIGCKKDEAKAIEYYKLAADLNYKEAVNKICSFYLNGKTTHLDERDKYKYYELLENKPLNVLKDLASYYKEGKNLSKAKKYTILAAEGGDIESINILINESISENKLSEVIKYKELLANKGDLEAVKYCAMEYESGNNVAKNNAKARHYYTILADNGDSDSQYKLGTMYRLDNGSKRDFVKAFKYYEMAAKQNHIKAYHELGYCYYYGYGCMKNREKAFECYMKAAEAGYTYSQEKVGKMYYYGEGVDVDYANAAKWLEKVFDAFGTKSLIYLQCDERDICCLIADAYHKADSRKNKAIYVKYYKEAARRGSVDAKQKLRRMLIFKY